MTTLLPRPLPHRPLSRRLLLAAAVAGLAATAGGCGVLFDPRPVPAPGPTTPGQRPTGQLSLIQGQVTTFDRGMRIGFLNRFDDRSDLSIVRDDDPAGFESTVGVRDGDVLPVGGRWWRFDDVGTSDGRAALTATPTDAPARPPAATLDLLFVGGRARLGTTSRMEITELSSSGATIKRWTGVDLGDDSDDTELITLTVGERITVGVVSLTAERFQPTSEAQRGYVAFTPARG